MICKKCGTLHEGLVHCIICNALKLKLAQCPVCKAKEINTELEAITQSASGAKSSTAPRFDLLPARALVRVAARYEKGLEHYGRDNWRKGINDKDYCLDRIAHIIGHCYKLIDKLEGREPLLGSDDDAGAVAWGGLLLCESMCEREAALAAPQEDSNDLC